MRVYRARTAALRVVEKGKKFDSEVVPIAMICSYVDGAFGTWDVGVAPHGMQSGRVETRFLGGHRWCVFLRVFEEWLNSVTIVECYVL